MGLPVRALQAISPTQLTENTSRNPIPYTLTPALNPEALKPQT